jgi:hypothetical protein
MNGVMAELVALYAARGTAGVKDDDAFQALCAAHQGDSAFDTVARDAKTVMAELEENVEREGHDYRDQVRFALRTLNAFKQEKHRAILRELVRARYFPNWSDDQRTYFAWAQERLGWSDYFLSYTSYNPTKDRNVVNTNNRYLIKDQIPNTWKARAADCRTNLVAHMLDNILINAQLNGFFWERHQGDSEKVEAKLREHAQRSLVFVQLLQSAMFTKVPPPNFCRLEYELAAEDDSRVLIFVRAEPAAGFISRDNVDIELRGWYEAAAQRDPYELATTRWRDRDSIKENLAGLETKVVAKVREARTMLFDGVPTT